MGYKEGAQYATSSRSRKWSLKRGNKTSGFPLPRVLQVARTRAADFDIVSSPWQSEVSPIGRKEQGNNRVEFSSRACLPRSLDEIHVHIYVRTRTHTLHSIQKIIGETYAHTHTHTHTHTDTRTHDVISHARPKEVPRVVRLTCTPQLCLQLDPSALPSLPLSRRDHRPRFPRHAFRTAVSDNGEQLLLISVT